MAKNRLDKCHTTYWQIFTKHQNNSDIKIPAFGA